MKKCENKACDRDHYAKGFCSLHYKRDRKDKFPEMVKAQTARDCRSPKGRYTQAKAVAARRGLNWNITFEDFCELIKLDCFYWPAHKKVETNSGLDRIDNKIGYEIGNVIPCCRDCNVARGSRYSVEEWTDAVTSIENRRKINGI